jgi:cell wall-associated NlpC family hydrolase
VEIEAMGEVSSKVATIEARLSALSGAPAPLLQTAPLGAARFQRALGDAIDTRSKTTAADTALNFASAQLGDRYVFGSNGPDTWDCSSLVQTAYARAGIDLPRTAAEQATAGVAVDPSPSRVKPGDLIFTHGGKPAHDFGHVGIAISSTEYIVAPHSGDVVKAIAIPWSRVQGVRRVS